MRTRRTARATLPTLPMLALALGACSDTTGPGGNLTDMLLDFCSDDIPTFFAVQNGSAWERVDPDGQGTVSFRAAEEFGIAIVRQQGGSFTSRFIFAAASELQPMNGIACTERSGTKDLQGAVSGVSSQQFGLVSMARRSTELAPTQEVYSLNNLPTGPLDLLAHRETAAFAPDRVIVRRALNFTSGATISPALDFDGGDSQATLANTLTVGGFVSSEENWILVDFRTATGTVHPFQTVSGFTSSVQTTYGFPAGLTQTGDLHDVEMFAYDALDNYRGVRQFNRNAGDLTFALGPALNTPTIFSQEPAPYVQLRAQVQSQGEYGAFVSTYYIQSQDGSERIVEVIATATYIGGTPSVWDITIPNLSAVSGFPTQAMLQEGIATTWYVDAFGGGALATFLGSPADGTSYRYAGHSSAVLSSRLSRSGGARHMRPSSLPRPTPLRGGI